MPDPDGSCGGSRAPRARPGASADSAAAAARACSGASRRARHSGSRPARSTATPACASLSTSGMSSGPIGSRWTGCLGAFGDGCAGGPARSWRSALVVVALAAYSAAARRRGWAGESSSSVMGVKVPAYRHNFGTAFRCACRVVIRTYVRTLEGTVDQALERDARGVPARGASIAPSRRVVPQRAHGDRARGRRRGDWQAAGCSSSAQWLAQISSSDYRTAVRITRTSEALRDLPALDHALEHGRADARSGRGRRRVRDPGERCRARARRGRQGAE